jgi:hypothetical protein
MNNKRKKIITREKIDWNCSSSGRAPTSFISMKPCAQTSVWTGGMAQAIRAPA